MYAPEERRTVVILFAQVTGLAELPTAERAAAADGLFARLRAVIERSGGVVDKFMGDVVMALWGAPVAHEDDPSRAGRASLELGEATLKFARESGLRLGLRGGINRGEVLFGSVAGERPTAMGDPVNVAQRLMAAAEEGTVIASRGIQRLAHGALRFRSLATLRLKGRQQEVEAFRIEGEAAGRTEIRLVPDQAAPIVGRENDLERLHALVAGGSSAFAVVTGDAGIGKSRLLAEFRRQLRTRRPDARVVVGRSLQDIRLPRFAFGEILRIGAGVSGFAPGDAARIAHWVETGLESGVPDPVRRENAAHLVALSLGYSLPGTRVKDMEPERFERETRAAWAAWFRAQAAGAPLLVCIEDLHWADDGTLALLESLAADLRDAPVAILATSRPEGRRPAGFEGVPLGDLGFEAAVRLAENAFLAPIAPELAAFLAEKSGGNPYYLEELVRYLREERLASGRPVKLDVAPSRLPDGIQGLLVARLDAMPEAERGVLKAAGAIGRVFWLHLTAHLAGVDPSPALESACRRSMVYPQGDSILPDDPQWIFKHALLRDAAYSLLTRKDRRRLHALAADRLETLVAAAGRRVRALAATHREAAGENAAAARLWLDCSADALSDVAYAEALSCARDAARLGGGAEARLAAARALSRFARYKEALEEARAAGEAPPGIAAGLCIIEAEALFIFGDFPGSLAAAERAAAMQAGAATDVDAGLVRARSLRALGRIAESRESLRRCLEAAAAPPSARIRARLDLADLDEFAGRSAEALEDTLQALADARVSGDQWLVGRALNAVGSINEKRGNLAAALAAHQECLEQRTRAGDRAGIASSLNNRANIQLRQGLGREAIQSYREAVALSREIGDKPHLATYLSNIGNGAFRLGDYDEARAATLEAIAIHRDTGNSGGLAGALTNLGILQATIGEVEEGIASFKESLRIRRSLGELSGVAICLNNIALACLHRDRDLEALPLYEEALRIRREVGDRVGVASTLSNLGNLHVKLGDLPKALACLEEALAIQKEIRDVTGIANTKNYLGGVLIDAGRPDDALKAHQEALEISEKSSDRGGTVLSLYGIGCALLAAKRFGEVLDTANRSLALARETRHLTAEAGSLSLLALALQGLLRHADALAAWKEAESCLARTRSKAELSKCQDGMGVALLGLGRPGEALDAHAEAFRLATEAGAPGLVRCAAENALNVARLLDDPARVAFYQKALTTTPPPA